MRATHKRVCLCSSELAISCRVAKMFAAPTPSVDNSIQNAGPQVFISLDNDIFVVSTKIPQKVPLRAGEVGVELATPQVLELGCLDSSLKGR